VDTQTISVLALIIAIAGAIINYRYTWYTRRLMEMQNYPSLKIWLETDQTFEISEIGSPKHDGAFDSYIGCVIKNLSSDTAIQNLFVEQHIEGFYLNGKYSQFRPNPITGALYYSIVIRFVEANGTVKVGRIPHQYDLQLFEPFLIKILPDAIDRENRGRAREFYFPKRDLKIVMNVTVSYTPGKHGARQLRVLKVFHLSPKTDEQTGRLLDWQIKEIK
jgi:hypothetical protein